MITVETLKNYGADVESGLSRCANNEGLYLRLVNMLVKELSTDALGEAFRKDDYAAAFEVAHKLKGGASNLGLTPIAKPVSELTELLRDKKLIEYKALYDEYSEQTKKLIELAE